MRYLRKQIEFFVSLILIVSATNLFGRVRIAWINEKKIFEEYKIPFVL